MENSSLPTDVWNDLTKDENLRQYLGYIRDLALEIIYVIMGTVGILDNLFVIITFALFIKITDKVFDDSNNTKQFFGSSTVTHELTNLILTKFELYQ